MDYPRYVISSNPTGFVVLRWIATVDETPIYGPESIAFGALDVARAFIASRERRER